MSIAKKILDRKTNSVDEKANIGDLIKELVDAKPSSDNAVQGKFVSILKGLAFSDDKKATDFMSKLMGAIDKSFL